MWYRLFNNLLSHFPLLMNPIQMSVVKLYRMPRKCRKEGKNCERNRKFLFIFFLVFYSIRTAGIMSFSQFSHSFFYLFFSIFQYFWFVLNICWAQIRIFKIIHMNFRLSEKEMHNFLPLNIKKLMICWLSWLFCVWNYVICWSSKQNWAVSCG